MSFTIRRFFQKTPVDLFRSGNAQGPKLQNFRANRDAKPHHFFSIKGRQWVSAVGENPPFPGTSSWDIKFHTGTYLWRIPERSLIPPGLTLINDKPNHWKWCPAENMELDEFLLLLEKAGSTPPWVRLPKSEIPSDSDPIPPSHPDSDSQVLYALVDYYKILQQEVKLKDPEEAALLYNDLFALHNIIESWPTMQMSASGYQQQSSYPGMFKRSYWSNSQKHVVPALLDVEVKFFLLNAISNMKARARHTPNNDDDAGLIWNDIFYLENWLKNE